MPLNTHLKMEPERWVDKYRNCTLLAEEALGKNCYNHSDRRYSARMNRI